MVTPSFRKFVNGRYIGISNVTTGMLLTFVYEKLDGTSDNYTALVIDPYQIDDITYTRQMHAYEVGNLADYNIIKFLEELDIPYTIDTNKRAKPIATLDENFVYNAFKQTSFYTDRPYRRFLIDNMRNIRQLYIETVS